MQIHNQSPNVRVQSLPSSQSELNVWQTGAFMYDTFLKLNLRLGLPSGLKELGVDASSFQAIAKASLSDNAHKTNPRTLTETAYCSLLSAAW